MSSIRLVSFAFAVVASAVSAQNPIAVPQETTDTLSGTMVPLGFSVLGRIDEGRFQQMIPARYLPGRLTVINGLDVFASSGSGTVTYQSLKITLSHTRRQGLSSRFAFNLPAPIVVFDRMGARLKHAAGAWTHIGFDAPFFYDGKSNLVVEFQKVVDSSLHTQTVLAHGNTYNPPRLDLPSSMHSFGSLGSGVSTSIVAAHSFFALSLRLTALTSTLTVRSDRGGSSGQVFALGSSFEVTNYSSAGNRFVNYLSVGFGRGVPLLGSVLYLNSPLVLLNSGVIGSAGMASTRFSIPSQAALVDVQFVAQGLTAGQGGDLVTNATDFIINR